MIKPMLSTFSMIHQPFPKSDCNSVLFRAASESDFSFWKNRPALVSKLQFWGVESVILVDSSRFVSVLHSAKASSL